MTPGSPPAWAIDRRGLLAATAIIGLGSAAKASGPARGPLYQSADPAAVRAAAQALIASDTIATLITVDALGQPRARSIRVTAPDADMALWMGTRRGSRKLDQIIAHPAASLHFSDDAAGTYLSLMGRCRIVGDRTTIDAKNPFRGPDLAHYFPAFPDDFALIGFRPDYLELTSKAFPGAKDIWQPEGLVL